MARPVLSIRPMMQLRENKLVTKKRVSMKLREMRVEPIRATRRHWNFSMRRQTIGLRKSGTDWIRPVVMKTSDSSDSF